MAAVADASGSFDHVDFLKKIQRALPPYARPVFLRICPQVDTTGNISAKGSLTRTRDPLEPHKILVTPWIGRLKCDWLEDLA